MLKVFVWISAVLGLLPLTAISVVGLANLLVTKLIQLQTPNSVADRVHSYIKIAHYQLEFHPSLLSVALGLIAIICTISSIICFRLK